MNTQRSTVIGVFHERQQAQRAVEELHRAGFGEAHLGVALRDTDSTTPAAPAPDAQHGAHGNRFGRRFGSGRRTRRPLGSRHHGGNAARDRPGNPRRWFVRRDFSQHCRGRAAGGLVGALIGLGIPEDEAKYYEGEFKSGKTVVTVRAENRPRKRGRFFAAMVRMIGAWQRLRRTRPATLPSTVTRSSVNGAHRIPRLRLMSAICRCKAPKRYSWDVRDV